jgi:uncharacterized protein YcbK (DUF882 family)
VGDLSPHFSRSEFRDKRTGELPQGMPTQALVDALEKLRAAGGGRPLTIISGYRTAATNRSVGGAPDSRHLHGDAADVAAGQFTESQAVRAGFRGIGLDSRGWVVHVDTRPGAVVTFTDHPR